MTDMSSIPRTQKSPVMSEVIPEHIQETQFVTNSNRGVGKLQDMEHHKGSPPEYNVMTRGHGDPSRSFTLSGEAWVWGAYKGGLECDWLVFVFLSHMDVIMAYSWMDGSSEKPYGALVVIHV